MKRKLDESPTKLMPKKLKLETDGTTPTRDITLTKLSRTNRFLDFTEQEFIDNKISFHSACETGEIDVVKSYLDNNLESEMLGYNYALYAAIHNFQHDIVKLLLKHKEKDPNFHKIVKFLLQKTEARGQVYGYCFQIAFRNNHPKALDLLFNDKKIGDKYIISALDGRNIPQIRLCLDYKKDIYLIYSSIEKLICLNPCDELKDLLFNHSKIDLNRIFLNLYQTTNIQYINLLKEIMNLDRFDVNSFVAYCYDIEIMESNPELKELLFSDSKLNFSLVLKELNVLNPLKNLEPLFVALYKENFLTFSMIEELIENHLLFYTLEEQNLLNEDQIKFLDIYSLIVACHYAEITKIENDPLVTELINDDRIDFNILFQILLEDEADSNDFFIELYQNKFLSSDLIIKKNILSEPFLNLFQLVHHFFTKPNVFIQDIQFRNHLLGHSRFHTYENTEEDDDDNEKSNIHTLFVQCYEENENADQVEDEKPLTRVQKIELLIPHVKKALEKNNEIVKDHYKFIERQDESDRKKQVIHLLPISEKCRFFNQAKKTSLLPELLRMITDLMIHHDLDIKPKDQDLNNRPKL